MSDWLSKLVGANGLLNLLVGVSSFVSAQRLHYFNETRLSPTNRKAAYTNRIGSWLLVAIGMMRLPVHFFPSSSGALLNSCCSYFVEGTWILSEFLKGTTANQYFPIFLYSMAYATFIRYRSVSARLALGKNPFFRTAGAGLRPSLVSRTSVKKVIFVRHGQSTYNLGCIDPRTGKSHWMLRGGPTGDMSMVEEDYIDAPLTKKGVDQALGLRDRLKRKFDINLVVCSPLDRAIATAINAIGETKVPMVALDEVREMVFENAMCCKRGAISDKSKQYPNVDFSYIQKENDTDVYFDSLKGQREPIPMVQGRLKKFLSWVSAREETTIVVFCHGALINTLYTEESLRLLFGEGLVKQTCYPVTEDVKNCEVRELNISFPIVS